MRFFRAILRILTAGCLVAAAPAPAAQFMLSNGGLLDGELLNPDQTPRQTYLVRLASGARVTLAPSQVARVVDQSADLRWYTEALPKTPPTAAGHWIMAEECRVRGLKKQREFHLQRVLELDPNHEDARHGLGFSKVDGRWVLMEEWMTGQGYVRYRGVWRLPQDVSLEMAADDRDLREKEWKRKVKTWVTAIEKQRGKEQDAIKSMQAIKDPAAAAALAEVVKDTEADEKLRLLCVSKLGELKTPLGVATFIERVIEDANANVRDACLDELARTGTPLAVAAFTKLLISSDNKKVNRAAVGLARMQDREATLALIDALNTEHKFLVQQGGAPGSLNLGFGNSPGGGGNTFSAGGQPKLVKQLLRNADVFNALIALHPGTNFNYDEDQWRNWFVGQNTPAAVDLRRDP